MLLPVFTGSHPMPQPNWGYRVAMRDLQMLQPLHEVIQQLLCGGLTSAEEEEKLEDLFHRQAGVIVDVPRLKQTWTETGPSTDLL
jgi:hypothetical protein